MSDQRHGVLVAAVLLVVVGCGGPSSVPKQATHPDFYGKPGSAVADALHCTWKQLPIEPGSPGYDVPPTDEGLCTFPDGEVIGILTWPDEAALRAGVEVTAGAFSDYPDGDYFVSYGRGWQASGDDDLDRESAVRPLKVLDGTLGYFHHLGRRATPSPVPYPSPS